MLKQREKVILDYLQAFNFKPKNIQGYNIYEHKDAMTGNKYLEYYFQGNNLTLVVYLRSINNPMPVDDVFYGWAVKGAYKKELKELFDRINNPYPQRQYHQQNQQYNQQYRNPQNNQYMNQPQNSFADVANDKNNKAGNIGLALSGFGLILTLFGIVQGGILIIFEYYFGAKALKSDNKWKGVLTMIFTTIHLLIMLLVIIGIIFG